MIKLSDYLAKRLVEHNIKHIFMISGGGAMHLNDSIGKCKEIEYICNHHEQASAIGAEGYSRVSGKPAVVMVTTGPGGTNTITGVMGQWTDSVPVLYISGQVKQETCASSYSDLNLRQLGDQEVNIVDLVKPITKFAVTVKNPNDIKKLIDKAIHIAANGRPGPVWLDIPINIQSAMIDEASLSEYNECEDEIIFDKNTLNLKISEIIKLLENAERPVIVTGHGIRISGSQEVFLNLASQLNIPIVSTFNGFDLIPSDHPLYVGRIGTIGDRAGNFALQNSDLALFLGTRNNIRQISYNWKSFARAAKKIVVDIDKSELDKPTIKPDITVQADIKDFLKELSSQIQRGTLPQWRNWQNWCIERKNKYDTVLPEYKNLKRLINPYYFSRVLSESLNDSDIVITGNGTASVCYFQAGIVKNNQRVIWNSGCASMGYDLPAAIGACIASNKQDVICLAGDGSLQMNIQELQTVIHNKLPIKLFVLNNEGYISIRQTQDSFFNGRYVASNEDSGVSCPDIVKIAQAYGIPSKILDNQENLKNNIAEVLAIPGPVVCEVRLVPDYIFSPKLSSETKPDGRIVSKPLEDMYPFLDREEFKNNMLIPE